MQLIAIGTALSADLVRCVTMSPWWYTGNNPETADVGLQRFLLLCCGASFKQKCEVERCAIGVAPLSNLKTSGGQHEYGRRHLMLRLYFVQRQ
jgi:hypothetical protein